jgi:hypothetical protein
MKTVDKLSGKVTAEHEQVWRYDEQDRLIYQSSSTDGEPTGETVTITYDGREQSYIQVYLLDTVAMKTLFADDSLHRILSMEIALKEDGVPDTLRLKYGYDEMNRLTGVTSLLGEKLVDTRKDYIYEDRKLNYSHIQYSDGEVFLTQQFEIDYADDQWSLPERERISTMFKWDSVPQVSTHTYRYDRRGRLVSKKISESADSNKPDEVHSDFRYRDKRLTYLKTEFASNKPIRETRVTVDYKY